jgi:hypothetical protein
MLVYFSLCQGFLNSLQENWAEKLSPILNVYGFLRCHLFSSLVDTGGRIPLFVNNQSQIKFVGQTQGNKKGA